MKDISYDAALFCLETEEKVVRTAASALDKALFARAVDLLAGCPKIITCASGTSGVAAKKFAHSLCCIERDAIFLSPAEAVHGGLGCVKAGDAVVFVSRGGKTAELLPVIDVCAKKGAHIIAVTENMHSPLTDRACLVLPMHIDREGDPLGLMATASFVAVIALFDALLAALIAETGFTADQFALIHPGGAVGEKLSGKDG